MSCQLFKETATKYLGNPDAAPVNAVQSGLREAYTEFLKTKMANPTAPYGSSDKANTVRTPMALEVPKIRHAHLTFNVSIFYTISGSPATLKLYAMLSHDESGTGQPIKIKVQKSMGRRMANQEFKPIR
jgi:hypothetical protein